MLAVPIEIMKVQHGKALNNIPQGYLVYLTKHTM